MPVLPITVEEEDVVVEADVEVRGAVRASSLSAGRVTNDLLQALGMGVLVLHDIGGDEYRIWVDDSGNLRIKQGLPTYDGDGSAFSTFAFAVQPANPDTSGATLPNLEIEVNQIKALLRSVGLMSP